MFNRNSECFIIAEVGLNHNGDYDLARKSVIAAAQAGATAVKFQTFKTEDFLFDRTITHTYQLDGKIITEPLFDLCKRAEFDMRWWSDLQDLASSLGIMLIGTPTSVQGVDDLINHGATILKNGSDYLTHLPLIRYMANTQALLVLSTGMADEKDIDDAVSVVQKVRGEPPILLHCTSSYPADVNNLNLNKITSLRQKYGAVVGFSDHSEGWIAAVQALALGAKVIEKHFTLDKSLPGPDHWFSSSPEEMEELVCQIRDAEKRMGCAALKPADSELAVRNEWRLGLVWNRDIKKGDVIKNEDVTIKKPAHGLLPKQLDDLIGLAVARDCCKGKSIFWGDLQQ